MRLNGRVLLGLNHLAQSLGAGSTHPVLAVDGPSGQNPVGSTTWTPRLVFRMIRIRSTSWRCAM